VSAATLATTLNVSSTRTNDGTRKYRLVRREARTAERAGTERIADDGDEEPGIGRKILIIE
jgi:hypothetical protein